MAAYYEPPYAPPPYRVVAYGIDFGMTITASLFADVVMQSFYEGWMIVTWLVLSAAYFIVPTAIYGATPGKRLFRMQVVREDGERILPDAAILRYLVLFVSQLAPLGLLVSFFLIMTDREHRALHDRLARTIVVMRSP